MPAEFSVTILGSGTSLPSPRMAPAYLVRAGGATLLLDCGAGCTTSLFRAGASLEQLNGIFLSHLHPDHCADLVPLLFALTNPAHPPRTADLRVWGPPGTLEHLQALEGVYGHWIRPPACRVLITELGSAQAVRVGPLTCTGYPVRHSGAALAYRFSLDERSFCYSGDSGPCPALVAAARDVELLLCECSALEGEELEGHLTATQVGELAAAAGCRQVVLTHLYERIVASNPVPRVQQRFTGPVELATDGMVLGLSAGPR